jgi:FkbM family methyltransferase
VLPPVVPPRLILDGVSGARPDPPPAGIIAGNIWSQRWLDGLRNAVKRSGVKLDWYCNGGPKGPGWLNFDGDELRRDGITMHPALPEADLVLELRRKGFALIPIGTSDEIEHQLAVTRLSLPSRLPFITATSHTPIIVMGDSASAAARFVRRFGIGIVCDYDRAGLVEAVKLLSDRDRQRTMRNNAAAVAEKFSSAGIADWIWSSLDLGAPCDQRFEELMPAAPDEFAYHVEPPVPASIHSNFAPTYTALRRLKSKGFDPDFVIDVGASNGPWSHAMSGLFPDTRFILIEPLASRYNRESKKFHIDAHPNFELIEAAVSDKPGRLSLHLASDLYNSSVFPVPGMVKDEGLIDVRCTTLDEIAREKRISGCGLVKIDVQHAEHLVIKGGLDFISNHADALVLEITLAPPFEGAKGLLEMISLMERIGFRYSDDVGEWRSPVDGRLEQKDILFVRQGKFS